MTTYTTNLGIPLVDPSQAQKEATINEAITCLDAMIGGEVASRTLSTPPASPVSGVVYIVGPSPTGAWAGQTNALSYFDQIWRFINPLAGMRVYVLAESLYCQYSGSAWIAAGGGAMTITSSSATALAVGANGTTNPAFTVDASTASSATGVVVKSAAAGSGVTVTATSSGTNENLTLTAKGGGIISLNTGSTSANAAIQLGSVSRLLVSPGEMQVANVTTFSARQLFTSSSASSVRFNVQSSADTSMTASTEAPHTYFNLGFATRNHLTGPLALQRDFRITGTDHSAIAASTFTDVAAFSVDQSTGNSANATITNLHNIYVPSVALTGTKTNSYGLTVNANTGATNNYAAYFNGSIGIGTASPNANALLEIASTTKAFLPPRMTTTQKAAIASPTAGMVVYDTNLNKLSSYNGSLWDANHTPLVCQGRLTLTSGLPVTVADVTAATSVYFTPYKGARIALYDGVSSWMLLAFSELSIAVPATASTLYDLFAYNNAGVVAIEALAWTNDTTRATALVLQDGVYVKTGATTRRYLGSFRTTTVSGQTEDSKLKRYVYSYTNRVKRALAASDATASWTYSTATWRQANGNAANQVDFIVGVAEDTVSVNVVVVVANSTTTARSVLCGIGLDGVSPTGRVTAMGTSGTVAEGGYVAYEDIPAAGRHYLTWLEQGAGADTQTWTGTSQHGIAGFVMA